MKRTSVAECQPRDVAISAGGTWAAERRRAVQAAPATSWRSRSAVRPLLVMAAIALLPATAGGANPAPGANAHHHLVACAPGYPGSTRQAQPTMDDFAAMLAAAAGRDAAAFTAEYQEREEPGVERLRAPETTLALVPLPFFLKYEQELDLQPFAQTVDQDGEASEVWSLIAAAGKVAGPENLDGWELTGIPGYAPAFVRGPVLGSWGALPESTRITFTRRVLGALRRVAAGEPVAVLLDRAQTTALADLPQADAYEVVTHSPPLPVALLTTVGGKVDEDETAALREAVLRVHESARFQEVLDTLRLTRFAPLDEQALEAVRTAYRAAL